MKKSFVFISIAVYMLQVASQSPEAKRYNFAHYTEESGLNSYQINSTVQDDDGYIWIATNEGLQRYDGLRYKNFRHVPNDSTSIPSKRILQILIDKNKNFWLLSENGKVGTFNSKKFTFKEAAIKLVNNLILESTASKKRLVADEFGNVFLLLPGKELLTYNKIENEFSVAHNFFLKNPEWAIEDFVQQPGTKKYWMCLGNNGFAVYNHATGNLSSLGNNLEQEIIIKHHKTRTNPYILFFDAQNRVWHGGLTNGIPYIYGYDPKKKEVIIDKVGFSEQITKYHEIHQFLQQQDGTIWISGINILGKYLEIEKQFQQVYNGYLDDRSIDFVVITNINEDREHSIWVSTGNNGLFRFNPSQEFFTNIEHPSKLNGNMGSGAPISFMRDLDGSLLVGVWNDKLYRYDKDFKKLALGIQGFPKDQISPVLTMCLSGKGNFIWMGVKDGVYRYDQQKRYAQFHYLTQLKSRIREIAEDKKGNLWIGLHEHGIYKWNAVEGREDFSKGISKFTEIPSVRINVIMIDKNGFVWVGTLGEGVYVIDPETDKIVNHLTTLAPEGSHLSERTISTLLDYNDSLVLIGTRSNLLTYNRLNKKLSIVGSDRTTTGFISAMEKDTSGYVWLSTTTGLYRVHIFMGVFIKFNRNDGIRNDFFVLSASYVLPNGKMLFGATRTLVAFDPSSIKLDTDYPTVYITDFKVLNRSLPLDSLFQKKAIELAPYQNSITIDLSTLSYNSVYTIRYKLEGMDNDWKVADRTHQLIYPFLPSGSYKLLVNSTNSEGAQESNPLVLNIEVAAPYWKTWWFYGILSLAIGAILFWFDKIRIQQKIAVHRMRNDIAVSLSEEVNSALNNINILSEMAKIKAKTDPKKSTEFIDQIHTKSHNMIIAMDDMLWSISPENDSMGKTVERMREYIDALNNRYNSGIEILVEEKVKSLKLDMQFRHDAFFLFKENILGLVRASASRIQIYLTIEKPYLLYSMQFNNEGCDMQQLTNLQHNDDINKWMEMIKAKLQLQVHGGNSIMELKIPISP